MSTCVCVLSNSGERLMPTFRLGKVRRLLKDGKAKIVNKLSNRKDVNGQFLPRLKSRVSLP